MPHIITLSIHSHTRPSINQMERPQNLYLLPPLLKSANGYVPTCEGTLIGSLITTLPSSKSPLLRATSFCATQSSTRVLEFARGRCSSSSPNSDALGLECIVAGGESGVCNGGLRFGFGLVLEFGFEFTGLGEALGETLGAGPTAGLTYSTCSR